MEKGDEVGVGDSLRREEEEREVGKRDGEGEGGIALKREDEAEEGRKGSLEGGSHCERVQPEEGAEIGDERTIQQRVQLKEEGRGEASTVVDDFASSVDSSRR